MPKPTDLYDLLATRGLDGAAEYPGFHIVWAEGIGGNELARRLGAEPAAAYRCGLDDMAGLGSGRAGMWAGAADGWVLAFMFDWFPNDLSWIQEASRGTRLLNMQCASGHRLDWAVDGVTVVAFNLVWPSERFGADPTALDQLMRDLHFQLDEPGDIFNEDPTTVEVSVTSALRLAGRLTGREIDAAWLDRAHSTYLF